MLLNGSRWPSASSASAAELLWVVGRAVECCACWTFRSVVQELRDTAEIRRVGTTGTAAEGPECIAESTERWPLSLHYGPTTFVYYLCSDGRLALLS